MLHASLAIFYFLGFSDLAGALCAHTRFFSLNSPTFSGGALTTFVTTFFLAEAYKYWSKFYWTTRGIQGRFNDINLIQACNAARNKSDGKITDDALRFLDDSARIERLLHQLFYCSTVDKYKCLHSPEGFSYLFWRHLITESEYASLIEIGANSLGGYHAALTWLISRAVLAQERGELKADHAAMVALYDQFIKLRAYMGRVADMFEARMPLAYVHFVHLLVGVYIGLSPFALFPQYWFWSIFAVGIITLFYYGIFKLSLMFLDPVDNDEEHQRGGDQTVAFDVGVLIQQVSNIIQVYYLILMA